MSLDLAGRRQLAHLERVIEQGMATFVTVGTALAEVRDSRLYQDSHGTFEAYCDSRWNLSRTRAYELMSAAGIVSAIADTAAPAPANEGQARALAAAAPDDRADVMATVAAAGKPTAKAIEDEIKARRPTPPPATPLRPKPEAGPADEPICRHCGTDDPSVTGGWCSPCWEASQPEPTAPTPLHPPVPKPQTLGQTLAKMPEALAVKACWGPARLLGDGLRTMPPVAQVMDTLPADSLESFDYLAEEAIEWGQRWQTERKAASGLRLMKETR